MAQLDRTEMAIASRAVTLKLTGYNAIGPGPVQRQPEPAAAPETPVVVRMRPSSVPLKDRIPDFLRPDFASWGVG